jgi:dsRNA-specific ribonuclease
MAAPKPTVNIVSGIGVPAQPQFRPQFQPFGQTPGQPPVQTLVQPQTQFKAPIQPQTQFQAPVQPQTQFQAPVQPQPFTHSFQAPVQPQTQFQTPVQPQTQFQTPVQPQTQFQPQVQPQAQFQIPVQPQTQFQPQVQPQAQFQIPVQPQTQFQAPVQSQGIVTGKRSCAKCYDKMEAKKEFLHLFFPKINGRSFKPVEKRNYTVETLSYMSSPRLTSIINEQINKYLPNKNHKYNLIECCSSIGGDTFGFLSNPNINKVIAHEINPIRRDILKNNLNDYGFPSDKYEIRGEFTRVPPEYKGSIVYFDPPWIDQKPEEEFCTCDQQYISRGIKVAGRTLEDWFKTLLDTAAMVVMKLPPGYKIRTPAGYTCHRKTQKGKVLILTCLPNVETASSTPTKIMGLPTMSQPDQGTSSIPTITSGVSGIPSSGVSGISSPRVEESSGTIEPERTGSIVGQAVSITPLSSMRQPSSPNLYMDNIDLWIKELQEQLHDVIAYMAIPGSTPSAETHRKDLVNRYAMEIWIKAFTHKSYDPNISENYDVLEFIGDRVLKTVFSKYMNYRFPRSTEDLLTKMETIYMSKMKQGQISSQLGLDKWIRTRFEMDVSVQEDLFESMFGAILQVGDEIIGSESGILIAYNLISAIFDGIDIDLETVVSDPTTQSKELLEKLSLIEGGNQKPFGEATRVENGYSMIIQFSPYAQQVIISDPEMLGMMQQSRFNMERDILAKETRSSKKATESAAYSKSIEKLAEIGFTREYSNKKKRRLNEKSWGIDWLNAVQKSQRDGYKSIEFSTNLKGAHGINYVQLIGIRPDGNKEILSTEGASGTVVHDLQIGALRNYNRST